MMKQQKGFTLAETLITLTILGVVAAITVPSLINKYSESANRTKVKKAMAAYEKALNQMIIENDLKGSVGAVKAWADTEADCALTTVYFKKILGSGCIFQTADKVWWDISDIEHPVISLKDEITTAKRDDFKNAAKSSDNNDVFGLVGYIDDGVVRINDKGAATAGTDDATLLNKTYAFMNNEAENAGGGGTTQQSAFMQNCLKYDDEDGGIKCRVGDVIYEKETISEVSARICNEEDEVDPICNEWGTIISTSTPGDIWFSENGFASWEQANSTCENQHARLATAGEIAALGFGNSEYYWSSDIVPNTNKVYTYGSGDSESSPNQVVADNPDTAHSFLCVGN